jgi:4'-phosphopantetheinyl transferase EntD
MALAVVPDVAFVLRLDHGLCVAVRMPRAPAEVGALAESALLDAERAFADGLGPIRRRSWVGGRAALRVALTHASLAADAVLPDDRGAPRLPGGIAASISHKEDLAVALVALEERARVGVDVELDLARERNIASRVLTDDEAAELAPLAEADRARGVVLRFSIKEAIYKALDPFVRRYVGFKEVGISPRDDGGADVRPHLGTGGPALAIEARWRRIAAEGIVLTTARVDRLPPAGAIPSPNVRSGS